MSIIIGMQPTSFTLKDSQKLMTGTTIFVTEPLNTRRGGVGEKGDKFFLSTEKASKLAFVPAVGMEINISYSKWGSISTIYLVEKPIDFGGDVD